MGCRETVVGGSFDDDSGMDLLDRARLRVRLKEASVRVAEVMEFRFGVKIGDAKRRFSERGWKEVRKQKRFCGVCEKHTRVGKSE